MKLWTLFLVVGTLAFGNQLDIAIALSPAGSFVAKSDQVKVEGELKVGPEGFKAKNLVLPIDSLKTGIELRDDHMKKKYFEVGQFPKAVLLEGEGSQGKFQGKLEVHGVTQTISGIYRTSGKSLEARFKCKLSDFKIKEAKYMGVGVDDEVKVSVKLQGQ